MPKDGLGEACGGECECEKVFSKEFLLDHDRFSNINIRGLLADMHYLLVATNSTVPK